MSRHLKSSVYFLGIIFLFISTASASPDLKIGGIFSLTGDAASYGNAGKNGMMLSKDLLPEKDKQRTTIIIEDDGLDPKRSVAAYRKLVDIDKVNVMVCFTSGTCNAIAPLAEKEKIPTLAIASDPRISAGKKFIFLFWVTPEEETRLLLSEIEKRGIKKVALVSTIQDGSLATRDAFREQTKGKVEIALDEEFNQSTKDFRTFIAKIRSIKNIDAIVSTLMPGHLGVFGRQTRESGVSIPLIGYEMFEDADEVKISNGALIGSWFATSSSPSENFLKLYREKYGDVSFVSALNCFDAVSLFIKATSEDFSPESIANFLSTIKDFKGESGTFSSTGDGRFSLPAALKVVRAKGFEPLG